jgi:hypothetical protein
MNPNLRSTLLAAVVLAVAGCSSIDDSKPTTLIPARTLNISPSLTIPAETIAAGSLLYFIIDPLAPNWKVQVEPIGQRRYRIAMTMKRFFTGGEGEVGPLLRRTAEKLCQERRCAAYAVLEQSEAIESRVTLAQRVAQAVIELQIP